MIKETSKELFRSNTVLPDFALPSDLISQATASNLRIAYGNWVSFYSHQSCLNAERERKLENFLRKI
jgi:hypothetical protein